MLKNRAINLIPVIFLVIPAIFGFLNIIGVSDAIDVTDGSLDDWDTAQVILSDVEGDSPVSMTDLALVSFDYDDTWLYVRWDIYDNLSYKSGVLYDMGINLTATGVVWDIFVSAEIDKVGGLPVVSNISIRDPNDNHLWNASDDGNMTEDGILYLSPTPGLPPNNLSVEARFPLASLGITSGVIFSQFRSHSSSQVDSAVKDYVPDLAGNYTIIIIDNLPPDLGNPMDTPDPQENGGSVNITVDVFDDIYVDSVWVNITYPDATWVNVSMANGTPNQWFFTTTYDMLGIYSYTIWANDLGDNWNLSGPATFTIQDTDGPFFDNLNDSPDPQEIWRPINVTVDVWDDIGLGLVWINFTRPNGTWLNTSMISGTLNEWYLMVIFNQLGNYNYTIWANDTQGNWNSTGSGTILMAPVVSPEFTNVTHFPNPQENGGNVNITVDIIDNVGVVEVWINITLPDGTHLNTTMDTESITEWFYNSSYPDIGDYPYTIWANDTDGNWNRTTVEIFTIQDTDGPYFSNLLDTPDPQENDGAVNITIDITDDIGVSQARIQIDFPDSTTINVTMSKGPLDQWFYNSNFAQLGIHTYTIFALDTSGNSIGTLPQTFTIRDTDGPWITNLEDIPDPQENDQNVNLSVDVTDDVGVDSVFVNITFPDSIWQVVQMLKGTGSQWYFSAFYDQVGIHSYEVWAYDTSANMDSTITQTFTIQDTDGPQVEDPIVTPDPQENDGDVNITVDITDDVAVDEVWVEIEYPNGTTTNVSMEPGTQDTWYISDTFTDPGLYNFTVWAKDPSGNWVSHSDSFTIIDTDGPQIDNIQDSPDPQERDEQVRITVDVTDDIGVEEVWLNIVFPDGRRINASMQKGEGDSWYYDHSFPKTGDYTYTVSAVDESGNWENSETETVTIEHPRELVMLLMLFFWPILLILFTLFVARRYQFTTRYKRDTAHHISKLMEQYAARPEGTNGHPTIKDYINLSQKTGIPLEEYLAASSATESGMQGDMKYQTIEIISELKEFIR